MSGRISKSAIKFYQVLIYIILLFISLCAYNRIMNRRVFLVWFSIFIIWSFYRANINTYEWIDEFIFKPLIFVVPVIYIVLRKEKKALSSLGLCPKPKDAFLDVYFGVVIGIVFAFEGLLANYLKYGEFSFTPILAAKASAGIIPYLLINLATSVSEEILGRGYLFTRLFESYKHKLNAALTSSFLFFFLHIPIMFTRLDLSGSSLLIYTFSVFLLGITNCYILSIRKSLVLPVLIHLFWNMTVSLYL